MGIGAGDKVVLPAYDFFSLPKSVSNSGALENVLAPDVKAVVAEHIRGAVAQIDRISDICRDAGVFLIEDCAQAAGAVYAGRKAGSWGVAGAFSFGGVKLMTSGQGGMITTSDRDLYERCHAIVNRGMDSSFRYS